MASVTHKEIVDQIIAGDGYYDNEDPRVIKVVEYTTDWGGTAWGLIYEGEDPMRYHTAPACHNPRTLWEVTN
jgi:hypothetical protein